MTVTLTAEQWDAPPPECPACAERAMRQEFKPVSVVSRAAAQRDQAHKMAEDIAANDYHVGNMDIDVRPGDRRKVRYKDQGTKPDASTWGIAQETLSSAIASGRQTRMQHGSGLDVLQANLKSGAQPDLIELSKKRSARVW